MKKKVNHLQSCPLSQTYSNVTLCKVPTALMTTQPTIETKASKAVQPLQLEVPQCARESNFHRLHLSIATNLCDNCKYRHGDTK